MKQFFFRVSAIFFVVLGIIGAFLPIIPTVPFLLAALYFASDTPWLNDFINRNRFLKHCLEGYQGKRQISKFEKYATLTVLWISLAVSFFLIDIWYCRTLLLLIGAAVSWHLLKQQKRS